MTSSGRSETLPPSEGLIVGELVGPHGVIGEVKLYPLTDFPERLRRYRRLILLLPDGTRREVRVQRARPHKNVWLLKLREIHTPEEVDELRGAKVIVPPELIQPLPEGHFYLHEVIGLRVVTPDGEDLGRVTDVLRTPANDVYVAGSLMIPAVTEMIERLDPSEGVLVVRSKDVLQSEEVEPEAPRRHGDTEGAQRKFRIGAKKSRGSPSAQDTDSSPPGPP
jgi:16S rRNA processing protein RimM